MQRDTIIGLGFSVLFDLSAIGANGFIPSHLISIILIVIGVVGGGIIIIIGLRKKDSEIKKNIQSSKYSPKLELINKANEAMRNFRLTDNQQNKDKHLTEFEIIKQSCSDSTIDKWLSAMLEYELHCDHFNINYYSDTSILIRDKANTNIRDYIYNNTKNNIYAILVTMGIFVLAFGVAWAIVR